jgi:hypothetical protein
MVIAREMFSSVASPMRRSGVPVAVRASAWLA